MTKRVSFRHADLARMLKVIHDQGITVSRVEVDAEGKIVIVSGSPAPALLDTAVGASDALQALRDRNAKRRAERLASRPQEARGRH